MLIEFELVDIGLDELKAWMRRFVLARRPPRSRRRDPVSVERSEEVAAPDPNSMTVAPAGSGTERPPPALGGSSRAAAWGSSRHVDSRTRALACTGYTPCQSSCQPAVIDMLSSRKLA